MFAGLTGVHLVVIVFIVLLLFGAPKLPALARSLGQSMKILKQEVQGEQTPPAPSAAPERPAAPAAERGEQPPAA